jgi:hypothetical protein
MEKLIYLVWGEGSAGAGDALRERLLGEVVPLLLASGVHGLSVNVHDSAAAPAPSPAPAPEGEEPHVAQVSLWLDTYEAADAVEDVLGVLGLRTHGYLVVESLYDDYGTNPHAPARHWSDGERSPAS